MAPPTLTAATASDLLSGEIVTTLWSETDRSSPGMHGGAAMANDPVSLVGCASPVPCPVSPVPCPVSPVPCPISPVPCPLSPVPCPLSPVPCPLSPVPCK